MEQSIRQLLKDPAFAKAVGLERKHFAENAEILKQGDTGRQLYIIESGTVRVLGRVTLNDNRQINPGVCDLTVGDIFGELTLFDQSPRSATVTAVSECALVIIDGDKLLHYLEQHPDIGFKVLRELMVSLVSRLRNTNEKILSLLAWGLKAHQVDDHLG
jgi:CRP-like cAMP-binding protein